MKNYPDPFSFSKNLPKGAIGFERMIQNLQEMSDYLPKMPVYPPYNIKKVDEDHFVIEMAVAGFGKQNLDIELKEDELTITGNVETQEEDYVHKGIADRAFTRRFTLADSVVVKNAELANGMLRIFLERFIPEEKKAKKINIFDPFDIAGTTAGLLNETAKAWGVKQD